MVDVTDKAKKYRSVAYYPGCALEGTGNGYDVSTRAIAKKLDLETQGRDQLELLRRHGGQERRSQDPDVPVGARALAGRQRGRHGRRDGAVQRLLPQPEEGRVRPVARSKVDRGRRQAQHQSRPHDLQGGQAETIHALDWLKATIGEDGLRERTHGKLAGLKVANYYGCMYVRPRHIFPEKDKGPGTEIDQPAAFHGRPARRGRRRERRASR